MKRHVCAIAVLVLAGAACFGPASAQTPRQQEEAARAGASHPAAGSSNTSSTGATTTTTTTTQTDDKERQRKENVRKEYEARRELERRERIERERARYHPGIGYGYDDDYYNPIPRRRRPDPEPVYYPSEEPSSGFRSPIKYSAGVVFAPAHSDRQAAVGVQWLSSRGYGVGAWFSGEFGRNDDVLDAMIPHNDYYTENSVGSYGIQALYGSGSEKFKVITGIGFVVDRTYHTAVSNATGWKWNAGSDQQVKFAGQLGFRMGLGERVNLQIGYDTVQSAFFGLSANF